MNVCCLSGPEVAGSGRLCASAGLADERRMHMQGRAAVRHIAGVGDVLGLQTDSRVTPWLGRRCGKLQHLHSAASELCICVEHV